MSRLLYSVFQHGVRNVVDVTTLNPGLDRNEVLESSFNDWNHSDKLVLPRRFLQALGQDNMFEVFK